MKLLNSLVILFVVVLTGCESNEKVATTAELNSQKIKNSSIKQYPGKPHAAVEMHYEMKKNINAAEEVLITMTFTNTKDVDDLLVSFKLDTGLTSTDALQQVNFGVLATGQTSVVKLSVTAANNGLYQIYVDATLVDNNRQSRSFAIPVNVGNVGTQKVLKPNDNLIIDSTGQRIIKMPAQMRK